MADVQRMAIPELTRIFGQYGLYLRPSPDMPESLSGNMLGRVISLHRTESGFGGQLHCADAQLPIAGGCLSLVYALFVIESSPDPAMLMQEIARALKPEGIALVVSVNPWSSARPGSSGCAAITWGRCGRAWRRPSAAERMRAGWTGSARPACWCCAGASQA